MKRFLLFVLLTSVSLGSLAWSQNPNTPWLPVGLNGETGPIGTVMESGENQMSLGVTAGGSYYSGYDGGGAGYESYTVTPNIGITEQRPRTSWTLQYSPGYSYAQESGTQLMQNLITSAKFRLTERLTLQLSERYTRMNSWYTGLEVNPTVATGNVIQQPNQSVLTTNTVISTSLSSLNLVYQASESTVVGMGGSFNTGNFSSVQLSVNQPLYNSNSGTASAYVSHRIRGSNWLGVTGTFQRIVTTGQIREGADNPSVQLFYTFAPSAHTSVSLFAGPSYFTSQAETQILVLGLPVPLTIPTSGWGTNFGATVGWRGERTSVNAQYSRRISDGGGLTGATRSDSAAANFRRQLTQRWTANGAVMYGDNNSVSILYGATFHLLTGTANLNWLLSDHFSVTLSYARDHLQSHYDNLMADSSASVPGVTNLTVDQNRAWVSVSYHFTRPLGW